MTKFVPGVEIPGEFTSELPVTVEVAGDRDGLGRYLRSLAGLPRLWLVERFSFKAASAEDPRSEVRASVAARAYSPR
jgi:Tfp pilus assembly protein PilO